MKIIKLQAENVKRLKAVEITPEGNVVIISGKNGQGKSSILDSIWMALAGGEAAKETSRPIRDGEKKAGVVLNLGDLVVTRTWTDNSKSYLKVDTKEGASFKSPQKMLDALVGRLSFDPLAFAQQDDKIQLKTLQELVGVDLTPYDAERKELYDQRTFKNREVKQLEGQLSGMKKPADDVPAEEVSTANVLKELRAAQEVKNANNEKRRKLQDLKTRQVNQKSEIETISEQIRALQQKHEKLITALTETNAQGKALQDEVAKLADPNLDSFQEKLNSVEDINRAVRNAKEYAKVKKQYDTAKTESEAISVKIEGIDKAKEDVLKTANFPINGLGFDSDGVTFKGIPFKQCSKGEKLRISTAMAMAMNPKLRVIRITDGSLLDSENMKLIEAMAKDNDFQVWIEKVDETGSLGVYIEDGEVVEKTLSEVV